MAGRRVTLIDGDLRKPQIHRLFRLGNSTGLASLLAGASTLADSVQRLDGTRDLAVLSAGPPPPDPAEVLTDPRLPAVLAALAAASDLVVIDAPPLLAVTDPTIVAQHCDGVLMVATADLSTKREWTEALARLAVIDATIYGTVLMEPDDRIRAVPTYRYAPSAVPHNWWVSPAGATAETGLRVVGGSDVDEVADTDAVRVESPADLSDDWTDRPAES
jgi:receptor protein-tyrosine kinase